MQAIESLYIHVPFCRHLCNYCDFYKKSDLTPEAFSRFEKYLEDSWAEHTELMEKSGVEWGELQTLYLGGGTPSLWGERGARFLQNFLRDRGVSLADDAEVTLEVNPGSWTKAGLEAWRELGVNRYSLGVQSLDSRFLKILDRVHSYDDVLETLDFFSQQNWNFSVDLMLGLPFSGPYGRDVQRELRELMAFSPRHLSLYILTTKPQYVWTEKIPDDEWIQNEYLEVCEFLRERGLAQYEVSNFAKPLLESRHNLQYWRSRPTAALGPSATGFFPGALCRYKWKSSSPEVIEEVLDESSFRLERFYMLLRTSEGPKPVDFFTDSEELEKFGSLLEDWQIRGLLESSGLLEEPLILNSRGFLFLDSLMGEIFSRTNSL